MFITDILLNNVRKVYALGKKKHNKTMLPSEILCRFDTPVYRQTFRADENRADVDRSWISR